MAQFAVEHRSVFEAWHKHSKNIVVLSVEDENELFLLGTEIASTGTPMSTFFEPDIDNALTAIATTWNEQTHKLTSSLPLALKEYMEVTDKPVISGSATGS